MAGSGRLGQRERFFTAEAQRKMIFDIRNWILGEGLT
jgi:hypothetical protein